MCKSTVMKQAHAMCRATLQAGDNYHVTLGACLKAIKQDNTKQANKKLVKQAIATALPFTAFFALVCLFMALVAANGQVYNDRVADRANVKRMDAIETAIQARDNFEFAQILRKADALQAAHLATYK